MFRWMVFLGLSLPGLAFAQCPAFLDHDMRRLHSSETVNLCESFAGRPLLVVNTASHCGFTPQFEGLEALHQRFQDRGLAVVGFASDDFNQGARTEEEAAGVCYRNYGVSFTMIAPSSVTGKAANPVFREINNQSRPPGWNFTKYLIDRNGQVVERFPSSTAPGDRDLIQSIERLL